MTPICSNDRRQLSRFRLCAYDQKNSDKKLNSKKKTFAPVTFGSKLFSPPQQKMSIYCKEYISIYHAFMEYSHILWETTLLTLVMTDNRSVTRFFQREVIPPTLWIACDYVVQFNFTLCTSQGHKRPQLISYQELTSIPKKELS